MKESFLIKSFLIIITKINFLQNVCLVFCLVIHIILQLLSIVHKIDVFWLWCNYRVFLDITKAFDKVWDEGILIKLKT